jgi:hypothetical protein
MSDDQARIPLPMTRGTPIRRMRHGGHDPERLVSHAGAVRGRNKSLQYLWHRPSRVMRKAHTALARDWGASQLGFLRLGSCASVPKRKASLTTGALAPVQAIPHHRRGQGRRVPSRRRDPTDRQRCPPGAAGDAPGVDGPADLVASPHSCEPR